MSDEIKTPDWRDIQERLALPFAAEDIEWRIGQMGWSGDRPWAMVLAYLTNRAIQQRLDDVVGCGAWENFYVAGPQGGVLCGIAIYGVTKWDGADNTEIEAVKGGLSDSMKRAAVQWGMGRYLYRLPSGFAECSASKQTGKAWRKHYDKKTKKSMWWKIPDLPADFLPKGDTSKPRGEGVVEPADDPAQEPPATYDGLFTKDECLAELEKASDFAAVARITKAHKQRSIDEGWDKDLANTYHARKDELGA